jgi:CheY-like chemotaxis protein
LLYFGNAALMVTFNIRDTGNELLRTLEKELRSPRDCSLTIDMLIPDVLKGDRDGLCTTILLICQYLNPKLLNFSVNIELSKATHSGESLHVKIDVNGFSYTKESTQQFLRIPQEDVDAFLASLSYPTTFSVNDIYVRFSFTMPFLYERDSRNYRSEIAHKRVLLAEDDDMAALVFISFMEDWEYIVTRVADGVAAVEAAKLRVHDIILMDTFLAKMSGSEAIKKIREFDKRTPIIALTTLPIDKDFTDRYAGANDVFVKPVIGSDLQRLLRRYL